MNMSCNVINKDVEVNWKCIWLKQFLNLCKLVADNNVEKDRGDGALGADSI